jgi:cysteinyl-tRNA synthetase
MSTKYLGETFDIHGGGLDNIFPHNEGELAGSLTVNGVKMSKSLGNFLTIKEALKLYSPEAIRFFVLSSHYRSPVDFTREALLAAERGVERLHNTVRALRMRIEHAMSSGTADLSYITDLDTYRDAYVAAMDDDFNTPRAIASLFDLSKEVNALLASGQPVSRGTLGAIDNLYRELGGRVLGIIPDDLTQKVGGELVEGLMDIILGIRETCRQTKDWEQADALRRQLTEIGIAVEDRAKGPVWHKERRIE